MSDETDDLMIERNNCINSLSDQIPGLLCLTM